MTSINASSLLALRSQILQQNSALQKAAATGPALPITGTQPATQAMPSSDFGSALKGALEQVNGLQTKADAISNSYERGDTTDIAAVMLAREQASVGFQATLQVRNKLLSAYKDIMSMPV
ncbi:MAG TPA: flagellar hook-basal body complex protein FliE [Sphingomonas sp.]|nr:flagellar hook-basal body complex protein FliE [Sphingomonas sp.]